MVWAHVVNSHLHLAMAYHMSALPHHILLPLPIQVPLLCMCGPHCSSGSHDPERLLVCPIFLCLLSRPTVDEGERENKALPFDFTSSGENFYCRRFIVWPFLGPSLNDHETILYVDPVARLCARPNLVSASNKGCALLVSY
jgi:hypothetical protein